MQNIMSTKAEMKQKIYGSGDLILNGYLLLQANIVIAQQAPTVKKLASITVTGSEEALM